MFEDKATEDEFSLPRATVDKIISKINQTTVSKEARDCIRIFGKKFLKCLAGYANKICEEEKKKTINSSHVIKSLEFYGLTEFKEEVNKAMNNYSEYTKHKPSKQNKFKESGLTMEQLEEEQKKLFAVAKQQKIEPNKVEDVDIILDDVQELEENDK